MVFVVASAMATAVNAATALRKLRFGVQTVGSANVTASIIFLRRTGGSTVSSAATSVNNTTLRLPASAGTVATITHSVTPYRGLQQQAPGAAFAATSAIATRARTPRGASGQASVQSSANAILTTKRFVAGGITAAAIGSVQAAGRIVTGAYTVASFASFIVATDLNITQPAPTDRRMVVPLEERRMEVGES
jgi:hypothetical protein